jgi:hypothetical protein
MIEISKMSTILYALLTVGGAAIAWRSNPLYSLGKTVRFFAFTGLAVAGLVVSVLAVAHATEGTSATATAVSLSMTILLGTLFFIWVIVTASTPRVELAPGTKLVFVNRAHVVPWFGRLLVALALLALLVSVLRGPTRDALLVIGGLIGFIAILLLFTLFIAALGMDRSLTSVEAESWIHWRYTPDAWAAWRDVLVARTATSPRSWVWARDWQKFAVSLVFVAVASLIFGHNTMPLIWNVSLIAFDGIFIAAAIEMFSRFEASAPTRLRRLLLKAPPETYAGAAGIFCDGVFVAWLSASSYLISATIDGREPRCIDLEFVKVAADSRSTRTFTQSVLIPPNTENDILTLQTRLAAHCPNATIALVGYSSCSTDIVRASEALRDPPGKMRPTETC